jgi:glycine/D-amino acid oxidase-like deaminating enzyme
LTIVDGSVDAQPIETDVLGLDAGPAGCCAALRLPQLGHRVTLLERALAQARAPAFVAWASERPAVRDAAQGNAMVDRAALDCLLLETVSARGGRCLAPAQLERLDG